MLRSGSSSRLRSPRLRGRQQSPLSSISASRGSIAPKPSSTGKKRRLSPPTSPPLWRLSPANWRQRIMPRISPRWMCSSSRRTLRVALAFVIDRLDRRDLIWIDVTRHPTAEWIARQRGTLAGVLMTFRERSPLFRAPITSPTCRSCRPRATPCRSFVRLCADPSLVFEAPVLS